jgi:hypothetical protein
MGAPPAAGKQGAPVAGASRALRAPTRCPPLAAATPVRSPSATTPHSPTTPPPKRAPRQAHDYNRVVSGLDARERALFHDRLRALDRRVTPGLAKLAWTSDRSTLEFYFREVGGDGR